MRTARRPVFYRRAAAIAVTVWLAGIPVTAWNPWHLVVYRSRLHPKSPMPLVFWWTLLGPLMAAYIVGCTLLFGAALIVFYRWALAPAPRPSRRDLQQRITDLERELGIDS